MDQPMDRWAACGHALGGWARGWARVLCGPLTARLVAATRSVAVHTLHGTVRALYTSRSPSGSAAGGRAAAACTCLQPLRLLKRLVLRPANLLVHSLLRTTSARSYGLMVRSSPGKSSVAIVSAALALSLDLRQHARRDGTQDAMNPDRMLTASIDVSTLVLAFAGVVATVACAGATVASQLDPAGHAETMHSEDERTRSAQAQRDEEKAALEALEEKEVAGGEADVRGVPWGDVVLVAGCILSPMAVHVSAHAFYLCSQQHCLGQLYAMLSAIVDQGQGFSHGFSDLVGGDS
jgi:hypothetical protein